MLETVERKPEIAPFVTYSPELTNEGLPYRVSINPEECTKVLNFLDVPEIDIALLRINVVPQQSLHNRIILGNFAGEYNINDRKITLYTEGWWKRYQAWMNIARGVIRGKYKAKNGLFRDELYTERLLDFLTTAAPNQAFSTAERLFRNSTQRWFRRNVLHELFHAAQNHKHFWEKERRDIHKSESEASHFSGDFYNIFQKVATFEPRGMPQL